MNTAYDAAYASAAWFDRSSRARFLVRGRAPGQMLGGVVTGRIGPEPTAIQTGLQGERCYSTVLTPKGRMLSDLYLTRLPGPEEQFALDTPAAGRAALVEHFKRVMPPRLAKVEEVSAETRHVTLVGPEASQILAGTLVGGSREVFDALGPDETWFGNDTSEAAWVARSSDVIPHAFDVFLPGASDGFIASLADRGVPEGDLETWHTLRIEAGTPEFGIDMDESTIPIEAGLADRAIDGTKGCYTGQEVIVRIQHRGHVNRHLRTLRLEAAGPQDPEAGDSLYVGDADKAVGALTSVTTSPRSSSLIALGYVRREVELGSKLRVGDTQSNAPSAVVAELGPV